jgi:hypothetical protein
MPSKNEKGDQGVYNHGQGEWPRSSGTSRLGCPMDTLSPELDRITGIKVYGLVDQVPVQLGTRGSQLKISYGIKTAIKYGPIDVDHYFDVVNIDRYDVILGMVFMRRHGITLNFSMNQVQQGD